MKILTLILGVTGSGKSCSLRNLGADTVLYTERNLPFKSKGIKIVSTNSVNDLLEKLKHFRGNSYPKIKNIVIDSFNDVSDQLMVECKVKHKGGFAAYNAFNTKMHEFFQALISIENKFIFIIANPEFVQSFDTNIVQVPIHGKYHQGRVERLATCILYADPKRSQNGKGIEYLFLTNDSRYPAKSPMGMFEQMHIENDIAKIVEVYKHFYAQEIPEMKAAVAA